MSIPLIGLTCYTNDSGDRFSAHREHAEALLAAGVMPVMLPSTEQPDAIEAYARTLDGLVLTGGGDVDPTCFRAWQKPACGGIDPLRDTFELELTRQVLARGSVPVLGICRGFQVLNVALDGDLYQDLPTEYEGEVIAHRQKQPDRYPSHPVIVTMSSLLDRTVHQQQLMVNSLHHQAVRRLGSGLVACGVAPDGVIEAAELAGHPWCMGVQWHPERMWRYDDSARAIFRAFADACRELAEQKE